MVNSRPPFESDFIEHILLKNLSGMSDDARSAVEILAETGARPTEIIGLIEEDIILDPSKVVQSSMGSIKPESMVPHIWIRRNLKTRHSERKIPLVGMALNAFKKYPKGFNRWSTPDSFTASINKYLSYNDLLPSERHSLYSLRHTFKDRLRDAETPSEMIDELMGHKTDGPKYGRGHTLAAKQKKLDEIAYNID